MLKKLMREARDNNVFAAPDKLIDFVTKQFGVVKIRPDQKLFIEKNLEDYAVRVENIKNYLHKLTALLGVN